MHRTVWSPPPGLPGLFINPAVRRSTVLLSVSAPAGSTAKGGSHEQSAGEKGWRWRCGMRASAESRAKSGWRRAERLRNCIGRSALSTRPLATRSVTEASSYAEGRGRLVKRRVPVWLQE
jgi:hypothetical protein